MTDTKYHPSFERLLKAAGNAGIDNRLELAGVLGQSRFTVANWANRGVSKEGAMLAQEKIGCSSVWILKGEDGLIEQRRANPDFFANYDHVPGGFYKSLGLTTWTEAGDQAMAPTTEDFRQSWRDEISAFYQAFDAYLSAKTLPTRSDKNPIELDNNPDYPAIRRVAIKAQAGVTGYAVEYMNDDGPPIVFRKDWYALHHYQPEKMLALRVAGESMQPSLYADDLIVINTAQTDPKDGIAFAVAYEGEVVVKRLVRDDGQWWLTSDNPDQRRYPRKVCNGSTQIIGEVVYRQTERI